MQCRYCVKFKSVTFASLNYPKGMYKTQRECPFKGVVVDREDPIYTLVKDEDTKKTKKVFCPGFELDATFYCSEGYTISVEGCLKRQSDKEETQSMRCHKCKKKYEILEMKKVSFLLKRKREGAKRILKPIVR